MNSLEIDSLDKYFTTGVFIFLLISLVVCVITIFILSRMLAKRSRTLKMMEFTASPTGISLKFIADPDKKVEALINEMIILKGDFEAYKLDGRRPIVEMLSFIILFHSASYFLKIRWWITLKVFRKTPKPLKTLADHFNEMAKASYAKAKNAGEVTTKEMDEIINRD